MANIIKPKRSSVAGKVPTNTDIVNGEIAINSTDQKIYTNAGGTVTQVGAGKLTALGDVSVSGVTTGQSLAWNGSAWVNSSAGAGDVTGAASSTDNALVRFDGTTGKVIQNGNIIQDDNGNLANVNAVGFDTTPGTLPTAAGSMYWDTGNGSPSVILDTDVTLQVGQEMLALVYNGTGSTITNGSVVAVTGAQGQRPSVSLADADSESLSAPTLGIATEDIANGAEGFVTTFGFVRGLNTSGFTAGAQIYLSQTAGQFTATRPSAPAHTVALGWVIKVNASSGEVFVNINNGWELDELHNVLITSPTSGNTLVYDAAVGVWKNANITAGTGISVTNGAGSITIANTGVTSVGATAPIQSSGGATPTISITQAGAASNGYLSSTDWNTFNNKTSNTGTVTSVAMTVPTGLTISGTPITTSGTLALTFTAGYSIPTTASQTNWDTAYTDRLKWDGGSTGLVAATGRTSLGGTTVGQNFFTLTNPTAITFPRINADNTVSALDAATFRTAIGAGTSSTTGTVTSVGMTVPTGLSISGTPITTSGTLALTFTAGYSIPTTASQTNWDSAYTQRLQWDGGSTNLVAATGRTSLGATTLGSNLFTITNPSAVTFPRFNADNTVSALDAATFRSAIGAGTGSGTVTSVGITAGTGISVSGSPVTSSGSITVNNTGVTSVTAGTGISVSASTGGVTISSTQTAQNLNYDLFVATASQTSFSTSASYTSGKIQVFKNGALMRNGTDVTVTSGTAVVFAVACTSGDYVDIVYPPASSSGTMKYDQFTATASQTTFVTSQSYTSGKIQVFVNGALQRNNGDVTVTSGTQIVFVTGLAAGDLVDVTYPI